jgi:hypothetical protein
VNSETAAIFFIVGSGIWCGLDDTGIRPVVLAKVPPNKKPRGVSGGANCSFFYQKR